MDIINRLIYEEEGQGMAEYVMICMFIAIVAMVGYQFLGQALNTKVNTIGGSFS
jgi:Flp pilus assembly pilin Flp